MMFLSISSVSSGILEIQMLHDELSGGDELAIPSGLWVLWGGEKGGGGGCFQRFTGTKTRAT